MVAVDPFVIGIALIVLFLAWAGWKLRGRDNPMGPELRGESDPHHEGLVGLTVRPFLDVTDNQRLSAGRPSWPRGRSHRQDPDVQVRRQQAAVRRTLPVVGLHRG